MPNVSELQRQEEELQELKLTLALTYAPKSVKENMLREIRRLEGVLGIESKPYNGGK